MVLDVSDSLVVLGSTYLPRKVKYRMPVATNASPIGVTSKRWNSSIFSTLEGRFALEVSIKSLRRISGLEPTRVMVPPRIAQKPTGMSRRESGLRVRVAMRLTAGKKSATAPMFCINAEIRLTVPAMTAISRVSVLPASLTIGRLIWFMTPDLSSPAPIIITAMIEMTALLEKPLKISFGWTISGPKALLIASNTIMLIAATSTRTSSDTNRKMVSASTPRTHAISGVREIGSTILVMRVTYCRARKGSVDDAL